MVVDLNRIQCMPRYCKYLWACRLMGVSDPECFSGGIGNDYKIQQIPEELAALYTITGYLMGNHIKNYLEIGSAAGGFIRGFHEQLGFELGIMIDDGGWTPEHQETNIEAFKSKITRCVPVDSHSTQAEMIVSGLPAMDFIFIDGDHTYEGVKKDFELIQPLCHQHTIIGFHDIHAVKAPGVDEYWGELVNNQIIMPIADIHAVDANISLGIGVAKLKMRL